MFWKVFIVPLDVDVLCKIVLGKALAALRNIHCRNMKYKILVSIPYAQITNDVG